jgi:hypothetical protein
MAPSQLGTLHGQLSQSYHCTNTNLAIARLAVVERTFGTSWLKSSDAELVRAIQLEPDGYEVA